MKDTERIIGYRLNTTGLFGYYFYNGKKPLVSADYAALPGYTISATFDDENQHEWDYEKDPSGILIIKSREDGKVIYNIRRHYGSELFIVDDSLTIEHDEVEYLLVDNYEVVAQMTRALNVDDYWKPENLHPDVEPFFEVFIKGELRNDILLTLFCMFPMLKHKIK